IDFSGTGDIGDQKLTAQQCLFPPAKFGYLVLTTITECNQMEVIDNEPLSSCKDMLVNRSEGIDEQQPFSGDLDHEKTLSEQPLAKALPFNIQIYIFF